MQRASERLVGVDLCRFVRKHKAEQIKFVLLILAGSIALWSGIDKRYYTTVLSLIWAQIIKRMNLSIGLVVETRRFFGAQTIAIILGAY